VKNGVKNNNREKKVSKSGVAYQRNDGKRRKWRNNGVAKKKQ
jgi:hypothetical protein